MGCQLTFTVTDKYMPKTTIINSYAKPSIFLFNNNEWFNATMKLDMNWVLGNVNVVEIDNNLFH